MGHLSSISEQQDRVINEPQDPEQQQASTVWRNFTLQFPHFPLVIQLSKAGRDNAAKECWAVAAALLRAARLLTPPHRIQELELQAGMEQNPQKKRSTLCRGRRWWEPTLHGAQRSKVGRHAAPRHSPLYVLQKKTVNSPKHAGGETKQ